MIAAFDMQNSLELYLYFYSEKVARSVYANLNCSIDPPLPVKENYAQSNSNQIGLRMNLPFRVNVLSDCINKYRHN